MSIRLGDEGLENGNNDANSFMSSQSIRPGPDTMSSTLLSRSVLLSQTDSACVQSSSLGCAPWHLLCFLSRWTLRTSRFPQAVSSRLRWLPPSELQRETSRKWYENTLEAVSMHSRVTPLSCLTRFYAQGLNSCLTRITTLLITTKIWVEVRWSANLCDVVVGLKPSL